MATFAQTLNSVVAELLPLLNSLSARTDTQSQGDAAALTRVINALLTDAMQANAQDVESKLDSDAAANAQLALFTSKASAQAASLAKSEASVERFVSLATHVGGVVVSAASGNISGCFTALSSACGDLGIR